MSKAQIELSKNYNSQQNSFCNYFLLAFIIEKYKQSTKFRSISFPEQLLAND